MKYILSSLILCTLFTTVSFSQSSSELVDEAILLMRKNKFQKTIDLLTEGIELMPDSLDLYEARGGAYELSRQFKKSMDDFIHVKESVTEPEQQAQALVSIGGLKARQRDFEGAYNDLMVAYGLDSNNLNVLNNLAIVCDEVGRSEETLKYLFRIIELDPTYVGAYVNVGFKYQLEGAHYKAIEYLSTAIKLQPNEPLSYSNRSYSRLMINDLKGAMEDINKSIKIYPANSYAFRNRALIYLKKNKNSKACKDLNTAVELGFTQQYGSEVAELLKQHCQ